jgi:two-component system sensor histidine kinase UhpB
MTTFCQQRQPPMMTSGAADKLLRVPLFYKVLIANAAIFGLTAAVGAVLFGGLGGSLTAGETLRWAAILAASAVLIGGACSAFLTRLALAPLTELEQIAGEVEGGNLSNRAQHSPLADSDLRRLMTVFNRMLDRLEWYRARQREVMVRSLESEERARRWVASKLYDETAQSLAAVLLRLRAAGRRFGEGDEEDGELARLRGAVHEALESIRQLARELRPPELDEIGLIPALAAQVRTLSERSGIDVRLDADPAVSDLLTDADLALYRIVQEALANVERHAGASSVEVRIRRRPDGIAAEVSDDGKGFEVEAELERAGRGLGLLEMQERALYVGAELQIDSAPGSGTRVTIHMPRSEAPVTH